MTSPDSIQIPKTGSYRIDPARSSLSFTIRHLFWTQTVQGTFDLASGEINVTDPVTASVAEAIVSAKSFASGHPTRDEHVKAKGFLDVSEHPALTFRSTSITHSTDSWVLHGDLTVRNITAPLTFTIVESSVEERAFSIHATAVVDRYAFGITKGKGMAGRYLNLNLRVLAEQY